MTNEDFLQAVFSNRPEGSSPLGCTTWQNPKDTKWIPEPLPLGQPLHRKSGFTERFSPDMSNYVSIASCYPKGDRWSRDESHFAALHAFFVDDVGPKVNPELLTLPPSLIVETSPGNLQCWYLLDQPITDKEAASILINAKHTRFKDDAKGITRVGRLPVGSNTKYDPPWPQRVLSADMTRYSAQALIDGLGLAPFLVKPEPPTVTAEPTDIYATWLIDNGYVIKKGKPGWLNIRCPWGSAISPGGHDDDGRTGYKLPDAENPFGWFYCPHGKCRQARRGTNHLIDYIEQQVLKGVAA